MMKNNKHSYGFTLVEIMVAMVIGVIVLGGALSMHSATRNTQQMNESRMDMVADARFAISMITHDLRHAGMWGGTTNDQLIQCKSTDATCELTPTTVLPPIVATNDCATSGALWAYDIANPVFATDNSKGNPYGDTCISSSEGYLAGTDVLEIKYADSNPAVNLIAEQAYVRSNFKGGQIFIGGTAPVIPNNNDANDTSNHVLHAYAYYVSNHTDDAGDGIPSLRRASLVRGPKVQNQVLISGVVDLQVQFGEDTTNNGLINQYVNPNLVADWENVYAVKIWMLMRSDKKPKTSGIVPDKTFDIATVKVDKTDGFQYFMVTSIVNLRNVRQL